MTAVDRADGLVPGPQDPVTATPPRRPRSVRRTTSVDQHRTQPGGPQHVVACGRDLRTAADGTATVLDAAHLELDLDGAGTVTALEVDPPVPALQGLVGQPVRQGLRRRVEELVPDHRAAGSVLHQLLDDLPMAHLISGYGSSREVTDFVLPAEAAESMADLCAGWERGGTMLRTLGSTGLFPIPFGPLAPDLATVDDPLAWHELPPLVPRSVRRRRRLDLHAGDPLTVDVHFRDSHCDADGVEDVLHEYGLAADLDVDGLVVRRAEPTARVLPWPECPGALASAGRVVGDPVAVLRNKVSVKLTGTSTCTHLNDVLRSLAGCTALAAGLR